MTDRGSRAQKTPLYRLEETKARLRQCAAHLDAESMDWLETHPMQTMGVAFLAGWLIVRYPRLRRILVHVFR